MTTVVEKTVTEKEYLKALKIVQTYEKVNKEPSAPLDDRTPILSLMQTGQIPNSRHLMTALHHYLNFSRKSPLRKGVSKAEIQVWHIKKISVSVFETRRDVGKTVMAKFLELCEFLNFEPLP